MVYSPSPWCCNLSVMGVSSVSRFACSISRSGYSFWLLTGYNNDRVLLRTWPLPQTKHGKLAVCVFPLLVQVHEWKKDHVSQIQNQNPTQSTLDTHICIYMNVYIYIHGIQELSVGHGSCYDQKLCSNWRSPKLETYTSCFNILLMFFDGSSFNRLKCLILPNALWKWGRCFNMIQ